jgi:hypothetical protein
MTSLTQASIMARKVIRYGLYFLIFLIIGKFLFDIGSSVYKKIFPAPPPPPTVSFGKLPKLPFPEQTKSNFSYTLETAEGGLPNLATQTKVFYMPKLSPNLLSLDVAKEKASSLGFLPTEQQISQTLYRFAHRDSPATFEINIVTGIFSISYDLKADATPIERIPPAPEVAASQIRAYLSAADLLPADLTGPATHEFLKIESDKFVSALSLSESDLIKIDLFRKSYNDLSCLTSEVGKANIWFMVSGANERARQIIAAEFHYFPVDEGKSATYPLKTAQAAYDELVAGNAYIAGPGLNKEGDSVKIRKIYLAYYDAGVPTDYLQPIIVFEGDKGFIAYVPAVTTDYYGE